MRKGRNGLACIVREVLHRDPLDYGAAFIFYSKRYDMVKILHWDLNGYTMLVKWFEDGKPKNGSELMVQGSRLKATGR